MKTATTIFLVILIVFLIRSPLRQPKQRITPAHQNGVIIEQDNGFLLGYGFYIEYKDTIEYVRVYEYDFYLYKTGDTIKF